MRPPRSSCANTPLARDGRAAVAGAGDAGGICQILVGVRVAAESRGDIWLAELVPVRGSEAARLRPVVLVRNDRANGRALELGRGVVTVCPVTSNVSRVLRFQVALDPTESGLSRASKVQAEQVRSIDVTRRIGRVSPPRMWEVDEALRFHLDL